MTLRRIAALLLLICLVAPAAQAADLGELRSWFPQWLLEFVENIRDSLGAEIPVSTSQPSGPYSIPTG